MSLRNTSAALVLGLALTLVACDSDPVGPSFASAPPAGVSAANGYADTAPTFDAVLNEVSLRHPGFKGIVGSADGARTLVLADGVSLLDAPGLVADLASTLGQDPVGLVLSALPTGESSRPDFHELYAVRIGLRRLLFESDLVKTLDLNETTGRVEVGVSASGAIDEVRAAMTPDELAVSDVIVADVAEPLVGRMAGAANSSASASNTRSLLNSEFRPLIAGPQTEFTNPRTNSGTFCSQGLTVRYGSSTYGFLSNSHCTVDRSQVDGTQFFQPFRTSSDIIGIETDEPEYRSGAFITDGYYSDAAFVRTVNGINVRGQMTASDNCISGACTENGTITDVLGASTYLTTNVRVFKTGATTGSTAGKITSTCVDITDAGDKILCSSRVDYDPTIASPTTLAAGGDSGSLVMTNGGTPGSDSGTAAGLLWAGVQTGGSYFWFSPWENIYDQDHNRAGPAYGLPVSVLTASEGEKTNSGSSSGGGSTGGGDCDNTAIAC